MPRSGGNLAPFICAVDGQTALLLAAHEGNYDLAWLLLEAPYASAMVRPQAPSMTASQKTAGHDGTTPAPSAPKTPKTLRANANIASRQPMDEGSAEGDTPLHHAVCPPHTAAPLLVHETSC